MDGLRRQLMDEKSDAADYGRRPSWSPGFTAPVQEKE